MTERAQSAIGMAQNTPPQSPRGNGGHRSSSSESNATLASLTKLKKSVYDRMSKKAGDEDYTVASGLARTMHSHRTTAGSLPTPPTSKPQTPFFQQSTFTHQPPTSTHQRSYSHQHNYKPQSTYTPLSPTSPTQSQAPAPFSRPRTPSGNQLARDKSLPSIPKPHLHRKLPKADRMYQDIFATNVSRPLPDIQLPAIGSRIESTAQVALCKRLLLENSDYDKRLQFTDAQKDWLDSAMKETFVQEHIHGLATGVVEEFFKDELKDSAAIAEIILVAPTLDREHYRTLLSRFIRAFDEAKLQDIYLLQGMVQLIQSAADDYLQPNDFVQVLAILRTRLQDTHLQTGASEHPFHLTLAVSRVLDVMAESKVKDLNRVEHHEPLSAVLDVIRESSDPDPYLLYQVSYAFQALQYVPDEESALHAVLRHSASIAEGAIKVSAVAKLDLGNLFDGLRQIQKTMSETYDAAKGAFEGVRTLIQGGRGVFDALKEGVGSGFKRPWYPAIRAADAFIRSGRLRDFKGLVLDAPCRQEPEFQWGISQLLGEIAVDTIWPFSARQEAATLLIELLDCGEEWTKDDSVRLWMMTILHHINKSAGDIMLGDAQTRWNTVYLEKDDILFKPYPLVDTLPEPVNFPLLARVQPIIPIEHDLANLKRERTETYSRSMYIPPNAKASLLEQDRAAFPLTQKVKQFLKTDRKVFLLLGDSGAGKSMFNRHLECELWNSYESGGRIPLHINLPAINQPDQDMIPKQLLTHGFTPDQIKEMKENRKFYVICDGYDEGQLGVNLYNSNQFNRNGQWDVKMVISCRSTYLAQNYRWRFEPSSADHYVAVTDLFQEAVIVPFSTSQITEYVGKFVHDKDTRELFNGRDVWDKEEYMKKLKSIPNMMELVKNPFLLTLSLKSLPSVCQEIPDVTKVKATRLMLYDRFIEQWIEVSKRRIESVLHTYPFEKRQAFENLADEGFVNAVLTYSKNLATHITQRNDNNPFVQYENKDKETWKDSFFGLDVRISILRDSTPMTRVGSQYQFIHRSLVEYFYSRAILEGDNLVASAGPFYSAVPRYTNVDIAAFEVQSPVAPDTAPARTTSPMRVPSPARTPSPVGAPSPFKTPAPTIVPSPISAPLSLRTPFLDDAPVPAWAPSVVKDSSPVKTLFQPPQSLPTPRRMAPSAPVMEAIPVGPAPVKTAISQLSESDLVKDPSTLQFMAERVQQDEVLKKKLFGIIELSKSNPSAAMSAANAITILVRAGERFNGFDLSRVQIPGADISGGDFDSVNLAGADLTGATLTRAWLRHADFTGAQMRNVQFGEWPYLKMKTDVNACAYSPDGKIFAVGFGGGAISLLKTDTWEKIRDLAGHELTVNALEFSRDCQQLVSGGEDRLVKLWNVKTGTLEKELGGQPETVQCVVYSSKGHQIAAASLDSIVRVYDLSTFEVALELKGHTGAVKSVAFSPGDQFIASASYDWTVRLWDPKTGVQGHVMRGHMAWVTSVSISPTNNMVASGGQDMTVRLWNGLTGMPLYILRGHTAFVKKVSFSPSGHQLASGSGDYTARLWDGLTGTPGPVLSGHTHSVLTLSYSPDKAQIATGSWDSTVRLWDNSSNALPTETSPSVGNVECVAHTPSDLNRTYSGGYSSSSGLDIAPGFATAMGINSGDHTFSFSSVACSSDGQVVATCSIDLVRLYNANTGASIVDLRGHRNSVTSLAFSYDSKFLVSGSYDKTARIWNLQTGEGGHTLGGHTEAVTAVAYSPTGVHIATGSDDRLVKVWSARTGKVCYILSGHSEVIKSLFYSPDCKQIQLASGSGDSAIKLWHARDGLFDRELKGHSNAIESISYSSNGKQLVSGSRDGTVRIWDASSGQTTRQLTGHRNAVTAVAFSPNNLRIATGSWDMTVKIWDVETGKCLVEVTEFVGEVNSIAWKPLHRDDQGEMYFVTGCADKSVRMWKLMEPVDGTYKVQLHWRSAFDGLMVSLANVKDVVGLDRNNERLLQQRGTVGVPRWCN
ncbi:hypothetical protein BGX24_000381 [Mortierella sp. AD032]|nr:hypothetical protein BGX24_000381 [Mortierella sp. AD032]